MLPGETLDDNDSGARGPDRPVPGIVVVFSGTEPMLQAVPLASGALTLGRNALPFVPDERVSREHAELAFDGAGWTLRDLGSRNGTFVDGVQVRGQVTVAAPRAIRMGATVLLCLPDVRIFQGASVTTIGGAVIGPGLRRTLDAIAQAAATGRSLLITGESGSGKEMAAHTFHSAGSYKRGPFVAVNCAAIPEGLAERLLFGAKRGAYSGAATDAKGYCESAGGGVLFLDEIGELEPAVQPKLLRLLESDEVVPLGDSTPRKVDLGFVFATHRHLRSAVAASAFRADLYFRIAQQEVRLPPLRERAEEIPWLVGHVLGGMGLQPHARLIEICLLRPWPGNARELVAAVRRAGAAAQAANESLVHADQLDAQAGMPFDSDEDGPEVRREGERLPGRPRPTELGKPDIEAALAAAGGNVAAAARALGLHRTQLYRLVKKHGIEPPKEA